MQWRQESRDSNTSERIAVLFHVDTMTEVAGTRYCVVRRHLKIALSCPKDQISALEGANKYIKRGVVHWNSFADGTPNVFIDDVSQIRVPHLLHPYRGDRNRRERGERKETLSKSISGPRCHLPGRLQSCAPWYKPLLQAVSWCTPILSFLLSLSLSLVLSPYFCMRAFSSP